MRFPLPSRAARRTADPGRGGHAQAGKQEPFWLVYDPPQSEQAPDRVLLRNLQAIYPPPVENGPVSFTLRFMLWGATEPDARGPRGPLVPPEWRDAIGTNQNVVIPDGIIPKVWPEK